ncbi:MAG: LamG domain-containing protein [Planctomycetota bacterium]
MSTNSESVSSGTQGLARARHAVWGYLTAANACQLCSVCLAWVLAGGLPVANADDHPPWWDSHWRMRLSLVVDVGPYERHDKPVEQFLNFKTLLAGIGRGGETALAESFRVLEVDVNGVVIDEAAPFQFEPLTQDSGNLVFMLTGTTAAQTQRDYHLYFDTAGDFAPADVNAQVEVVDGVPDEGQLCYEITTATATYYFQKDAGGFSSLLDVEGNDWIGFHPYGGSDGIYRGIPNMVHPDNIYHPGHRNCVSSLVHAGPLKATIRSISKNGLWECIWQIYPRHARLTLLRSAPKPYWFLYEGTPGGAIDYDKDFSVRSNGVRLPAGQQWQNQDISAPEWVYFEDSVLDRYIYFVHEQDDALTDTFWPMQQNMTVFGFGRGPGTTKHMTVVPNHFTIGLADGAELSSASKLIEASYRPVAVTVGPATEQPGLEGHWRFDESQGAVAKDLSKYGRHALLTSVSWNPSGKTGSALRFEGTGGYAEVLGYTGVLGAQARTLSLWINTSVQADMDLVSWGIDQPGALWALSIVQGGGRGQARGPIQLDAGEGWMTGQNPLTDGQWHYVAVVLGPGESARVQDVRIYIDGRLESPSRISDGPVDTLAGADVRFGMRSGDSWVPFDGLLDDVRIYSRALAPEEIAELARVTEWAHHYQYRQGQRAASRGSGYWKRFGLWAGCLHQDSAEFEDGQPL